jgi:hypothetical protein
MGEGEFHLPQLYHVPAAFANILLGAVFDALLPSATTTELR